jgi:outer membrane protein assembly factor BamB
VVGSDGTVYVGSQDGFVYALHADGTLQWRYDTDDGVAGERSVIQASPALGGNGTLYISGWIGTPLPSRYRLFAFGTGVD